MSSAREQIIATTSELLEAQGYHATGLNQIVAESGAPKGSLYYYFPDGKEGLTAEVIERAGRDVVGSIRRGLAEKESPAEAVRGFILTVAHYVAASGYRAGGPITTVALETAGKSERLNEACGQAYKSWVAEFQHKLEAGGYPEPLAARLATSIIASIEGAIVLSRTYRTVAPLECAAESMYDVLMAKAS
jgi:TetR/AcrR family transcriptional regulator, lmrAB and yxaGH operons repressor